MLLASQIAIGIWLGGLFLIGTVWLGFTVAAKVAENKRTGAPWWRGLVRA